MPGRRHEQQAIDHSLCSRCQTIEPSITIRTHPLCTDCFGKYVHTKVVKGMEKFRGRNADPKRQRKLLLALSLGPCSVTLLHIVSEYLQGQLERTGRTGYRLDVLHIVDETRDDALQWDAVQTRYPGHEYVSISLTDSDTVDGLADSLHPSTENGIESLQITDRSENVPQLLDSLPSPTARLDVRQILMRRLITRTAKERGCEAILWGDSTTKLAARILAETAKGRGYSLPWLVADGESPQGIPSSYPLRELMASETAAYISLVQPSLAACVLDDAIKPAVSTRNTAIDDLMRQYFESVAQEYPSIVANVVRTTAKLHAIPLSEIEQQCELCQMPMDGNGPERSRLCYGCIRTLPSVS